MKAKVKVWKQGSSKIITVPPAFDCKVGEIIEIELIKPYMAMCKCGRFYFDDAKTDHKCYYVEMKEFADMVACQILLEEREKRR